jgi:hypothetical protein
MHPRGLTAMHTNTVQTGNPFGTELSSSLGPVRIALLNLSQNSIADSSIFASTAVVFGL